MGRGREDRSPPTTTPRHGQGPPNSSIFPFSTLPTSGHRAGQFGCHRHAFPPSDHHVLYPFTFASKSTARRQRPHRGQRVRQRPTPSKRSNLDAAAPRVQWRVRSPWDGPVDAAPQVTVTSDMGKLHQRADACRLRANPRWPHAANQDRQRHRCPCLRPPVHRAAPNEPPPAACHRPPKPPAIGRVQLEFDLPNRPIPTPRPGQIAKVPDRAGLVENARRSQNLALGVHRALRAS